MNENTDQVVLFNQLITEQSELKSENLLFAAWAAAYATKNDEIVNLLAQKLAKPDNAQARQIAYAVNRMGVTNPYFIARKFVDIQAGGTLDALNFTPFPQLGIKNEVAYHYACVTVSLINGGHVCLDSHASSLRSLGESDTAIDTAMRLAAVCHSLSASTFMDSVN
jgi:AhpD family alkylhydroperoxidase